MGVFTLYSSNCVMQCVLIHLPPFHTEEIVPSAGCCYLEGEQVVYSETDYRLKVSELSVVITSACKSLTVHQTHLEHNHTYPYLWTSL